MIEVKNLTKKYGEKLAVDHLSFKVNDGDVLGFLGPNGAGKSTTMNMLTGYLSATEGSIFVEGISMQESPEEAKRSIGYLPEIPPLYTDLTVMEYLRFVMRLKKVKGIRDAENYLTGICRRGSCVRSAAASEKRDSVRSVRSIPAIIWESVIMSRWI